jgi:hypothetical protein
VSSISSDLQPAIATRYGTPLPNKRRAVFVPAGVDVKVDVQLLANCAPADLSSVPGSTVQMRVREAVGQDQPLYSISGGILNLTAGSVQFALPQGVAGLPGVYQAETGVFDTSNKLVFTNKLYIWVDRGLFATNYTDSGPPQLDEVRNAIADYDPGYNLLLKDFEEDLTNICFATERAVRAWNEAQPPIDLFYNTNTWPAAFRNNLLQGITGYLYSATANGYLRNHLPYQAAGVSVDDQNKWQQYLQLGQQSIQQYQQWIKEKKTQLNCEAAITSLGSPYSTFDLWP